MKKRGPSPPLPLPPPPTQPQTKGKQNTCVYTCIKRSCRHITDPEVHVIVWCITEKHRYASILVWAYTGLVLLYKEVGCLKSKRRQRLVNHKVWIFFNWRNQHWSTHWVTPPFSHSRTLLLQLFSASFINWSWNQAKSASYCPLYAHSSPRWKMVAFPKSIAMIDRAMSSWPIIISQTDNAWLWCHQKTEKRLHWLLKMQPVLFFVGGWMH